MLAVVEHHDRPLPAQVSNDGLQKRAARLLANAQRVGERSQAQVGSTHGGQVGEVQLRHRCCQGKRKSCLAGAAGADDRDQALFVQQLVQLRDLSPAPDEARQPEGQRARRSLRGGRRRLPSVAAAADRDGFRHD